MFTGYITKFLLPFSQDNGLKYPDYNAGYFLELNKPHILSNDGWLQTTLTNYNTDFRISLYINNTFVVYNHIVGSANLELIPVKKGDIILGMTEYTGGYAALKFYPNR